MEMDDVPPFILNNNYAMPIIGLGTMVIRGEKAVEVVKNAIERGYRHIDTAPLFYNEKEVGDGIRAKIKEGVVDREEMFIASKLWNTYHEPHMVERACRNSLNKLGLDYFDLYLMHTPMGCVYRGDSMADFYPRNEDGTIAFKAMEKLVDAGLVRSLGLSNFNSNQIDRLLATCRIKPVTNQVEIGPSITQKKLRKFCDDRNILITGCTPLIRDSSVGLKPDLPPAAYLDPRVIAIGEKYAKTGAQIVLRYLNFLNVVLVVTSSDLVRIAENAAIFDFDLNNEEMKIMETFDIGKRTITLEAYTSHQYYPFHDKF